MNLIFDGSFIYTKSAPQIVNLAKMPVFVEYRAKKTCDKYKNSANCLLY